MTGNTFASGVALRRMLHRHCTAQQYVMELTLLGTLQKAVIRCHTQHEMDIGIRSSDRKKHSGIASALRGRKIEEVLP